MRTSAYEFGRETETFYQKKGILVPVREEAKVSYRASSASGNRQVPSSFRTEVKHPGVGSKITRVVKEKAEPDKVGAGRREWKQPGNARNKAATFDPRLFVCTQKRKL